MKLAKDYPIRLVCRLLDVPRSTLYYAAQPVPEDEAMLKTVLLDLAGQWPTYGYRRLTAMMRRLGWTVNGKRVRRWMEELHLTGEAPKRTTRTTNSNHAFPRYPNLAIFLSGFEPSTSRCGNLRGRLLLIGTRGSAFGAIVRAEASANCSSRPTDLYLSFPRKRRIM